jgi:VRR-NUC domain
VAQLAWDEVRRGRKLRTQRITLPQFVIDRLRASYARACIARGAPDLVIWNETAEYVRFVEVKCPDWDRPSHEQLVFHEAARALGSDCAIVEWRFRGD